MRTDDPSSNNESKSLAVAAIVTAVAGLLLPAVPFWELYSFPSGSSVRPMGAAAALFICGFVTPLIVFPFAILAFLEDRANLKRCVTAAVVSLLPLPIYAFAGRWIIAAHDLTLLP